VSDAKDGQGGSQRVGLKCRDCPYRAIWHPVRTEREKCKHDLVYDDHDVDYVDAEEIRASVRPNGEVVIRHDEQQELVTDGGSELGTHPQDEEPKLRYCWRYTPQLGRWTVALRQLRGA